MTLHQKICNELKNQNIKTSMLAKELDYNSEQNFRDRLHAFVMSESIEKWLGYGGYDLVTTAEEFVLRLAYILGLDIGEEIAVVQESINYFYKNKLTIQAITDYVRKKESLFRMMHDENLRNCAISDKESLIAERYEYIQSQVKKLTIEHYRKYSDEILGNITHYRFIDWYGNENTIKVDSDFAESSDNTGVDND